MFRIRKFFYIFTGILLIIVILSLIPPTSNFEVSNESELKSPKASGNLEGAEKILITSINREAELSAYGLVHYEDEITVKNFNNNPITSIFIGIPLSHSEKLIFFEATGSDEETLLAEREALVIDEFELIAIYFDSPLLPQQSKKIRFIQTYADMLYYVNIGSEDNPIQQINYTGYIYPILPYKAEGNIKAVFEIPESSQVSSYSHNAWGVEDPTEDTITYIVSSLDPLLENLVPTQENIIEIIFTENSLTKIIVDELTREIYISPWGLIKVKEEYLIKNEGIIGFHELHFEIPGPAKDVRVFDDLGEILGIEIDPETNYTELKYKDLNIDLSENRITVDSGSKFRFSIEYFLPFEKYISLNWIQESVKIDVLTSKSKYLGRDFTIKLIIEGCFSLDSVSESPDAIEYSQNAIILIYESEYVSPLENWEIQLTITINVFDMILRPVVFVSLITLLLCVFVTFAKLKKPKGIAAIYGRELIPANELREFCSLYEEKNALLIEIRQAEEDAKRKKIVKKKYKNILDKNNKKIEEIQKEVVQFKKTIREVNITFENIINALEILEAERLSVKDSLNLLEARYKRGRLPSRAAFLNLSDNFLKRRKKIDRSIDKHISTLRSYLL